MRQDERSEQILRTAATAFARGGFAATSMDDVAAEAGITRLIVYRHFDSKEDLYRAVLERVAERLRDEFVRGMEAAPGRRGFIVASMLAVARENPDGFRLLTGHALREPRFASYYEQWWAQAVEVADRMVGDTIADPVIRSWAERTIVAYLVEAVQAWLQVGEPRRDAEFVAQATEGLRAMYVAWASPASPT
jgi:AcrR family transcriptional regulator